MKYLIFLALVAQALARPAAKLEKPGGPKPSHPPAPGGVPHFDHHDVTGQPPHDSSSRTPHPEGLEDHPRHRRQVAEVASVPPPKNGNPPPFGGPPPSNKPAPPANAPGPFGGPPPSNKPPPPANAPGPVGGPPPSDKPALPADVPKPSGSPPPKPVKAPQPRFKRHIKGGAGNRPTEAPHLDHTHHSEASRPTKPTHPANPSSKKPVKQGHGHD